MRSSVAPATRVVDPASADIGPDASESLARVLAEPLRRVEQLLVERCESPVDTIPSVAGYLNASGGKRIRPLLTLAAARAADPSRHTVPAAALKLAAAVEFIHSATLLHDDVVDESDTRRGRAAARNVWGAPASILVGDFLFARAFTLMVETRSLEALDILSEASCVIAEGEVRQLAATGRLDLDRAEYLAIADAKTAALFDAAARAGALVTGEDRRVAAALGRFGRLFGRAFQLADDALDYAGHPELTGKAVGDDLRGGKVTLPLLIAREYAGSRDRAFLDSMIGREDRLRADWPRVSRLIEESGAVEKVLAMAGAEAARAGEALDRVPDSPMRERLRALAAYCAERRR